MKRGKERLIALCQGAALHYINGVNGDDAKLCFTSKCHAATDSLVEKTGPPTARSEFLQLKLKVHHVILKS